MVSYKYDCSWRDNDGWHFSFGDKRLWQASKGYIVADLDESLEVGEYKNHEHFTDLDDALTFMRTGKKVSYYIINQSRQPLSSFDFNNTVTKQQLKFRKRDCTSFQNRAEAEQYLVYIKKECRQRAQANCLKVSTKCIW